MVSHRSLVRHCEERLLRRSNLILVMSILFLFGCAPASLSPGTDSASEPTPLPATFTPAPDYATRLKNANYQLGAVDSLRVVQLTDGKFEQGTAGGADYTSIVMTDFTAQGDLNNDGVNEYAALISENYGGSGVFVFLAMYADVNGELTFQTSAWVDDRPRLNMLSIADGEIFLEATIHNIDEPMCCPTLRTARHYRLVNGQIEMMDFVTFTPDDRPRTIAIESPANGADVFSSIQIKGSVSIAPFENNLAYRIFDVGGVELAAGSITVNAPDLGAPGTFDQTIKLGNILSNTTIRIEVQDLSAADGSLLAMDSVELVVK